MEKEFVPYELAVKLKEIGFDEPCFGEYRQWDGNEPWLQLYQDLDGCSTDPADYEYTLEAKAPTFSQAFRWFREKYNLICRVGVTSYGCPLNEQEFYCEITSKNGTASYEIFNTYEEAELDCLEKLIELVEQK